MVENGYLTVEDLPIPTASPTPIMVTAARLGDTLNAGTFLAGISPTIPGGRVAMLKRCWCLFGANDTGANASHHTKVAFKVGTLASNTVVANLTTNDMTYNAGEILQNSLHFVIPNNKLLMVSVSKVGSTSTNMNNKQFNFGFDIFVEPI